VSQDGVGHAAEDGPGQATPTVGSHQDQAHVESAGAFDDLRGGRAFEVFGLDIQVVLFQRAAT